MSYERKKIALRAVVCVVSVAVLLLGVAAVSRLAWADYLSSSSSLADRRRATEMFPGNAEYDIRLIVLEERDKKDIHASLLRSVQANRWDASMWMVLGTDSQVHSHYAEAEKEYLEATHLSRTFAPRFALAKCYCEAGDRQQCADWLRQALKVPANDLSNGFALARQLGIPSTEVLSLIPANEQTAVSYLAFLGAEQDLTGAQPVADLVLRRYPAAGKKALLDYSLQLASGSRAQTEQAVALWNGMVSAGLLADEKIYPAVPPRVINGDFTESPTGNAFDWRVGNDQGITYQRLGNSLQILFDGSEPESSNLLWQMLSVKPGASYELAYEYEGSGLNTPSGLSWHVYDSVTMAEITKQSPFLSGAENQQKLVFQVPATCRFPELVLSYVRQTGTERINGSIMLKHVNITAQP